jgi:hypothetical protein
MQRSDENRLMYEMYAKTGGIVLLTALTMTSIGFGAKRLLARYVRCPPNRILVVWGRNKKTSRTSTE